MEDIIFSNKNFAVIRDLSLSSEVKEYIRQPAVVIAVPVLEDGRIILVEHKRPILQTTLLECPGGKVDSGEELRASIVRELEEEIGYTAHIIDELCYFYTSVGSSTENIHVFIARGLVAHSRRQEDALKMSVRIFTEAEIRALLSQDEIHDGKTMIALMKYIR